MEFRILTATPGSNKERIAEKIRSYISTLDVGGRKAVVGVGHVQQKLCDVCPEDLYLPDPNENRVALILTQLPQEKIKELWAEAFLLAVEEATQPQDGQTPDIGIVVTSLSFYRKQTYEFYCPDDPKWLAQLQEDGKIPRIGAILTLIDDIYDVYYRLSRDGHVFCIQQLVESELGNNTGTETDRYKKAMELVIQYLIRVLEWRESEIQASAALAATLGCRRAILAVKHPIETGVRVLLGDSSPMFGLGHSFPVYLSHPISVPRRENARTGTWPGFVAEFDDFVRKVRASAHRDVYVTPIMPTAIDEYRFLKDGVRLLPRLAPRWPLPTNGSGGQDELMYSAADDYESYEEYEANCLQTIFDPPLDSEGNRVSLPNGDERVAGFLMGDPEVSGMLRTLESVIRLQLANRDHLLVRQCPGFLLYRPTFEDPPRFTGGVRAEIRDQHFHRKFDTSGTGFGRPMAFVHSLCDLQRMFTNGSQFVANVMEQIRQKAREIVASREDAEIGELEPNLIINAMSDPGIPDKHVDGVHRGLFRPESGSISMMDPPSLDATKNALNSVLLESRVRSLCNGQPNEGWEWRYVAIDGQGSELCNELGSSLKSPPIMLASVVENLDSSGDQRAVAASMVQLHFGERYLLHASS